MGTAAELTAEAERLAEEVGAEPDHPGPELVEWHRRWDDAAERLAERAGWDGALLREALGPPIAVADSSPSRTLLVLAAMSSDLRSGFNRLKRPPR